MSDHMSEIKKIILAGVGAVAVAAEKSQDLIGELSRKGEQATKDAQPIIDDLAKKGADAFEKGKVITSDLREKIQQAFDDCARHEEQMDVEEVKSSLSGLTDEALSQLREHLDAVIEARKAEPPEEEEEAGE